MGFWSIAKQIIKANKEDVKRRQNLYNDLMDAMIKDCKMTREEAKSKLYQVMTTGNFTSGGIESILNALEALGLIKFDEPNPNNLIIHTRGKEKLTYKELNDILIAHGYQIVKVF